MSWQHAHTISASRIPPHRGLTSVPQGWVTQAQWIALTKTRVSYVMSFILYLCTQQNFTHVASAAVTRRKAEKEEGSTRGDATGTDGPLKAEVELLVGPQQVKPSSQPMERHV